MKKMTKKGTIDTTPKTDAPTVADADASTLSPRFYILQLPIFIEKL